MNDTELTERQKEELETRHRKERDGRVRDRIKAVLLKSEKWTNQAIAQALRIHEETVRQHLIDWELCEKLKPENGGSSSKLNEAQSLAVDNHISENTYTCVLAICGYVKANFEVDYTVSGMTKWLKAHGFSYKHPKAIPAKADRLKQEAFIKEYLDLVSATCAEEPILFMDSAHPTMATKVVCGWIKKGVDKLISQTASRTRVNVMGALELSTMKVSSCRPDYVNAETTVEFFEQLKTVYAGAAKIHIILDQSGYHRSRLVQAKALEKNIELHYLPAYSPNLNPIERLWKVMNEYCRNNVFFTSAKMFREAIDGFFEVTLPKIAHSLTKRINDNFQNLNSASSG